MRITPVTAFRQLLDRLAGAGMDLRPGLHALRRTLAPGTASAAGLVSIILPVRNRAGSIARAIDSVVAQSYPNWELIIIDDGSTDATPSVVRRYLAHRRIRYYRRPALGVGAARNAGLRIARGELVAYLDSDNFWDAGFLAGIVPAFAGPDQQSAYGMLLRQGGAVGEPDILFDRFDREKLLQANFIDLNVFVHRRGLVAAYGGFDEALKRLSDWDLILRYTADSPAAAVAVAGAHYRTDADARISDSELFYIPYRKIRAKWRPVVTPPRPVRVLYAVWQYPQLSETYIETEILAMRRLGAQVEVWSEVRASSPYKIAVPVHYGGLPEVIAAVRPDVVHVHWLNIAVQVAELVQPLGIPVTVRGHGFDLGPGFLQHLLAHPAIHRVYLYPHQIAAAALEHPRLWPVNNAFNTEMFTPSWEKNPRMVLRTSAALPSKDLRFFLRLAVRFPEHRFVLCIVSCSLMESHVGELLALRRELGSPAEILLNVPHEQIAALAREAGIYLHTLVPPDEPPGTPLGAPGSILEAMASGGYILVKNLPPLIAYVGDAGAAYADEDEAARLIEETVTWDAAEWRLAATRSVERAWTYFTGEDDFPMIYADWAALMAP